MTGKRVAVENSSTFNDFDALFNFENQQEKRPMTSGRRHQTNEDQLANDFTNEELTRFLP